MANDVAALDRKWLKSYVLSLFDSDLLTTFRADYDRLRALLAAQ